MLKKVKFKAFTIAETVTAMVIISIAFGAVMMTFGSVISSDDFYHQAKVNRILSEIIEGERTNENIKTGNIKHPDYLIKKEVKRVSDVDGAYLLTLTAYRKDNKQEINHLSEIISIQSPN